MKALLQFKVLAALVFSALILAGCGENGNPAGRGLYTISFSANGGNGVEPEDVLARYGSSITLPDGSGMTRTGYNFYGWNTESSGAGTNYGPGAPYTVSGKVTLYAKWNSIIEIAMVPVQGGTFTMGCTSEQGDDCYSQERPAHSVTVGSFFMSSYEVTQGLWQEVMGSLPTFPSSVNRGIGGNYPVYNVSWDDIQTFISTLNSKTGMRYRLPTEAEWEHAARGGVNSGSYKYSGSSDIGVVAWYLVNSDSTTHPVGTKQANELGIFDMNGNVTEWVSDWYGAYSQSAVTNPTGPSTGTGRVIRGGSWSFAARGCRITYRNSEPPDSRYTNVGFRLARPAD